MGENLCANWIGIILAFLILAYLSFCKIFSFKLMVGMMNLFSKQSNSILVTMRTWIQSITYTAYVYVTSISNFHCITSGVCFSVFYSLRCRHTFTSVWANKRISTQKPKWDSEIIPALAPVECKFSKHIVRMQKKHKKEEIPKSKEKSNEGNDDNAESVIILFWLRSHDAHLLI